MLLAPAGIAQRRGAHGVLEAERGGAAIPIRSPLPPRTVGVVGSGARSAWPGAGRIGLSGRGRPGVVGSADVDGGGAGRGSGISSSPGSGGEVEDAVAQGLEPSGGQVADDDPRIRAARDLHRQLAQSEDPAQQRADDIDGLDAPQAAGQPITWTGGFYFRVRFMADTADFENIIGHLWAAKKIEFVSVKL